jgi:small subunit ribosomal protein S1
MIEEEKTLTPNPSENDETSTNPVPSEEQPAEKIAVEINIEEVKPQDPIDDEVIIEGDYKTEVVSSGPLSEEIRVIDIKDLQKIKVSKYQEQQKVYESSLKNLTEEQRVIGSIVSISDNEIMMDVGFKSEGIISRDEFEEGETPKIGDQIEVFVDVLEDEEGQMRLSKRKADFMRVWERVRDIYNNSETIEGRITNRIKGGMVVDIMGIDAFLPGSQIDIRPVTDFDSYVGKTLEFKIVKLNDLRKNIVLSRKEILEESMKEKREDLLSKIKIGDVLKGRVKNITDFGVFIDLGGLDGLLHITDLSWGRVNHPKEVVKIDDELTVKVIDYDPEKQRVSLGLKQLTPHPWEGVEERYPVGSVVKGKVVNIANYGVFVELEKGVEGLIHISEISWTQHIKHPSEVFSLGEEIEAKVLNIDTEERKISLGYKQLEPDPWQSIEQTYVPGSIHRGIVRNLTPYSVFVELQEGIDGFVHISDLSWIKKLRHPREMLKRGDEIDVKVLEVSKENRRITLGVKQVEEDPWPMIQELYAEGKIVTGEVAKITDKIIIVNLEHEVEGIVPIGQIPKKDRKDLGKVIKIGDKLEFKVLEVNKNEKRVVLSREQAMPQEPKDEVEAYMMKQPSPVDKIEIPEEIREKIADSEKVKAETKAEKPKKIVKKATVKKVKEEEPQAAKKEETVEKKPVKKTARKPAKTTKVSKEAKTTKEKAVKEVAKKPTAKPKKVVKGVKSKKSTEAKQA